jgi:hypothetical protein
MAIWWIGRTAFLSPYKVIAFSPSPELLKNPKLISIVTESYPSEGVRYLS